MNNIRVLEQYRDKSYINNILCQLSSEYYGRIKNIVSIPLILSSSIMTVLNASNISQGDMKYANVILNSTTALILSLTNSFKIPEKHSLFRELAIKFNKLTHKIEDMLMYVIYDAIQYKDIKDIIAEYDKLNEDMIYAIPNFIKVKIKNTYKGKKTLPNILNCETSFDSGATNNSSKSDKLNLSSSIVTMSMTADDVIRRPLQKPSVLKVRPQSPIIEGSEESV